MATERIGIEQSSQRNIGQRPEQKAEQLREEISRTRSALSEDVKALGERLNPEQLKEDAKEMVHHAADVARDGAKNMVRDAKDAAFDSLRHAKEQAFESISTSVDEVSQRARQVGRTTSDFVATHAIPLTLLGAGAGWLLISMSHQRRLAASYPGAHYGYGEEGFWDRARDRAGDISGRAGSALSNTGQRISERAHDISTGVGERAAQLRTQVSDGAHYLGQEARDLGHRAYDGIERAGTRAREVSERNPLAVGLFALAAGVTVAMLLPPTRRENQLLGRTRDRLIEGAQQKAEELKSSVQRSADEVREVIDEIRSPGSTHA